ncbi:DUF3575 domain-containing protein [Parabacteroides timonensis]|uniref:DUF3575 domain-containing protein n=1 Tax=Parabacteroides timonensis TaxID=1871013 RepID=UPI001F23376B|nr:DUF3575 domain-containing protein [Parabacteroides timonensis]
MKQRKSRRIVKTVLCVFLLCSLLVPGVNAQITRSYTKAESFLYSFVEEKDLFLVDYGDNAYYLQRMNESLTASRDQLLRNTYHLLIVAHVNSYNYTDDAVVNEASLRASRIRAYLRSKLNIPHECVAFYIDRSGDYIDQVHVYQVHAPLPWFANQEISCSESRYPNAVADAVKRYGAVPYVDMFSRGSSGGYEREIYVITDPLFDRSELDDYRLATVETGRIITAERQVQKQMIRQDLPEEEFMEEEAAPIVVKRKSASAKQSLPKRKKPVSGLMEQGLAIKTNLLPWATIAPSMLLGVGDEQIVTGAFMPNLEVEYYFGRRWSVALAGMYADFAYKDKTKDHWAISSVTLSPKVWPLAVDEYRWLNTGLFFQYGDFDVRGDLISKASDNLYGRTGRFISLGASVGCLIPLGAGFCTEASLSAGYRSVYDGKKYRYDNVDAKNYLETRFSSTGFMLGFNISLVYRFQIR